MLRNNIRKAYSVERMAYSQDLDAKRYPCLSGRQALNAKTFRVLIYSLIFCVLSSGAYCFAQGQSTYDSKGRRDPFIPLVTPDGRLLKLDSQESSVGLTLEGIIYDEHGLSCAIVNGEVVRISDKVGEYQVLKILKNKVIFIKGAETTEVELKEEAN